MHWKGWCSIRPSGKNEGIRTWKDRGGAVITKAGRRRIGWDFSGPLVFFLLLSWLFFGCGPPDSSEKTQREGKKIGTAQKAGVEEDTAQKEEVKYYSNGQVRVTGNYRKGERHGVWVSWYKSGTKKSETTFKRGKKNGPTRTWYKNGKLRYKGWFDEGQRTGTWEFYDENGKLVRKKEFGDE